jgi:putative SOS response-associated peptidase YedK
MPGVCPDYPAPVVRNVGPDRELTMMRWGMPPPKFGGPPVTNTRNTSSPHWRGWLKPENRCLVPANSFSEYAPEPNPLTKKKDVAERHRRADTSEGDAGDPHHAGGIRRVDARAVG